MIGNRAPLFQAPRPAASPLFGRPVAAPVAAVSPTPAAAPSGLLLSLGDLGGVDAMAELERLAREGRTGEAASWLTGQLGDVQPPAPALPSLSTSGLATARMAALSTLPPALASSFGALWNVFDAHPGSQAQLARLCERGALQSGDKPALLSLSEMVETPRAPGWQGEELARQTVQLLDQPDETISQGSYFTCAASNMQRKLAAAPATLTQLVEELSEPSGVTRLGARVELARVPGSEQPDDSGRNAVNRLVQNALMQAGRGNRGDYDPARDRFADGGRGMQMRELASLTARAEGVDHLYVHHETASNREVRALLQGAPEGATFQTAMFWEGQDHMLLFQGCRDGVVTFFNPQSSSQGTMELEPFLRKVQFVLLPESLAAGVELPASHTYRAPAN